MTSPTILLPSRRFRDTYRDGVHSYLDGLHEQLTLGQGTAKADDGSFIVQIGPDNIHEVVLLNGRGLRAERIK